MSLLISKFPRGQLFAVRCPAVIGVVSVGVFSIAIVASLARIESYRSVVSPVVLAVEVLAVRTPIRGRRCVLDPGRLPLGLFIS